MFSVELAKLVVPLKNGQFIPLAEFQAKHFRRGIP
jgi:hypothetical protein